MSSLARVAALALRVMLNILPVTPDKHPSDPAPLPPVSPQKGRPRRFSWTHAPR